MVGTGSEVEIAVKARELLQAEGTPTRVVSMPCREWFEKQTKGYQEKVLPSSVRARVSVEAGISMGWHDVVGDSGRIVSIEHFGASADAATLFREFGITADAVVKAGKESIKAAKASGASRAPGISETNPARAAASAATDVMGADVSDSGGSAAAASTTNQGK